MKMSGKIITAIYLVVGSLWIVLGDYWVWSTQGNGDETRQAELLKGFAYIFVTGLGLYYLLRINEKQLKTVNREYKRLFRQNPNPMWIYDAETLQILAVNEAAISQYLYSREEFLKLTIMDLRPEEEQNKLEKTLAGGLDSFQDSGIWIHRDKQGRRFYCHVFGNATTFKNRSARMVVSINVDGQVKNRFKILEQNKKLRKIAQLTAHDLRSPISSILGLVSIFDKTNSDHKLNSEILDKLEESALKLDTVAREMVGKTEVPEDED